MRITNDSINFEDAIKKEWLLTNGIGGYASSTIVGANTRKYHGLLVAPLDPPGRRFLILSKLDESIVANGNSYTLATNMCPGYISEGFKNQISFEKDVTVKYDFKVQGIEIKKEICMIHGDNTVCVKYDVKTGEDVAKLVIAPVMNFRDFHTMTTDQEFLLKQSLKNNKIKIVINNNNETPIYMKLNDAEYIEHHNDTFRNMYYVEEEKRGFYPLENLSVPGRFEVILPKNTVKTLEFICSLNENIDEISIPKVIEQEKNRIDNIFVNALESATETENKIEKAKDIEKKLLKEKLTSSFIKSFGSDADFEEKYEKLIKTLIKATDDFVVYRPKFGLHTVIAGYPWFLDWGRDSLISFEGLFLVTKRYELAREIILTCIKDIKYGLVPNGYSGFDNRPLYNSVDSSLLLFEQLNKYVNYTGDYDFIEKNVYEKLVKIIHSYEEGIDVDDNNIYVDADGLLVSGTSNTQNTWMDAKIGNYAVTPRNGKAVEINALWYNALKIYEKFSNKFKKSDEKKYAQKLFKKCKKSFEEKFYNARKRSLYDVLGDSKVRPNQIFALALSFPIIDPSSDMAKTIFNTVTRKLLKTHGLKTLAKGEENYVETYEGDNFRRDMSYHQGITWVWLLGIYNDAFKNIIKSEKSNIIKKQLQTEYNTFFKNVVNTFYKEVTTGKCIGQISELYDSKAPYEAKGAIAQAWSVAEVLRIIS